MNGNDCLMADEPGVRLSVFIGIFAVMAVWEMLAPRRALALSKWMRWGNNIGLVVLNTVLLRLLFPPPAVIRQTYPPGHPALLPLSYLRRWLWWVGKIMLRR